MSIILGLPIAISLINIYITASYCAGMDIVRVFLDAYHFIHGCARRVTNGSMREGEMETTKSVATGAAKAEHALPGCKYSITCPQFCVGRQPLCNGSYEQLYSFAAWSPLVWPDASGNLTA
jgi:hypothetical protein